MSNVGGLIVSLEANIAKFTSDMGKAAAVAESNMKSIQANIDMVQGAIFKFTGALAGIKSVEMFKGMIDNVIQTKVELLRMSQQTGASVESLSAISAVSKLTGTSVESVASAMNKLQKNLATSNVDSKGAAQALEALGINFKEFSNQRPEQQMLTVANAMSRFHDGGGKSAAAMMLFGKAGAELLPMLAELAERQNLVGKQTTDSAHMAEEYEKNLKTLSAMGQTWKRVMVEDMLPGLVDVSAAMVQARKDSGLLASVMAGIDAFGNHYFDWEGNAKRKGISWIQQDIERLKASSEGITIDVFGVKSKLAKEVEAKTAELNAALKNYYKLTDGKAGGGRGSVNPELAKGTLDPNLGVKSDAKIIGEDFLKQLKLKIAGEQQDAFAMLRLEAVQKGVSKAAEKYIKILEADEKQKKRTKQLGEEVIRDLAFEAQQREKIAGFVDNGNAQAKALIEETALLGLNAEAQRRVTEMRKIDVAAQQAMSGATGDTAMELLRLSEIMKANLGKALQDNIDKQDELNASWQFGAKTALEEYLKNISNVANQTSTTMTNAFKGMEDALVKFVTTGKLNFTSLADSVITDIIRMMIQQSIMKPITAGFQAGGVGGMFTAATKLLGFADGGSPPVGVPSIVGENGPELFIPTQSGTIIPNGGSAGSAAGQKPVTVNQYFNVGDVASISLVKSSVANAEKRIAAGIARSQQYGGSLA